MVTAFNFAEVSRRVTDILRREFGPNASIRTDEGWQGRIHAKIVSDAFDGLSEDEKQAMIWETLNRELGPDAQSVSLVLAYGMGEI